MKKQQEQTDQPSPWKYRVVFERRCRIAKGDGFKVEAHGDDAETVEREAFQLYVKAINAITSRSNKPWKG